MLIKAFCLGVLGAMVMAVFIALPVLVFVFVLWVLQWANLMLYWPSGL